MNLNEECVIYYKKGKIKFGDWGLGPIPNPQSPIPIANI